jgi:pimeloyl-ACP methyl ester carboxylesterase
MLFQRFTARASLPAVGGDDNHGGSDARLSRLRRNGSGIHREVHGRGSAILLTHGFGATSRMWDEQIEEFTDRHRLILWDLPAHGESETPVNAPTQASLVEDMAAILDNAESDRAVLAGLGVGGTLSLRFWRAYPRRVRGLVLIGTTPGLRSSAARDIWNGQINERAAAMERDGLDAVLISVEVDPRLHACPFGLANVARALLTQSDDGALPWLADIDVPVLIVVGSDDKPGLTAAEFMARTIPNAEKIVIHRAGHAANMHKPGAVNAAIRDFMGRLPR